MAGARQERGPRSGAGAGATDRFGRVRTGARGRWGTALLCVVLLSAAPAAGQDSDRLRGYLQMRYGESNPLTTAHDVGGLSLGLNTNAYLGFDLSLDAYDLFLDAGPDKLGEIEVIGVTPQVRLRYPFLDRRLVPYALAGAGAIISQLNDTAVPLQLSNGSGTSVQAGGVFGAGIEYYVADNVAIGIEGRYLLTSSETFTPAGTNNTHGIHLSAGFATLGLRVLYPEIEPPAEGATDPSARRWYIGLRAGGALPVHSQVFQGITTDPEQNVFSTQFTQLFGFTAGVALSRWLSLEAAVSAYEYGLAVNGVKVCEYSLAPVSFQPRVRHEFFDGRVEAYALGGVGFEYGEVNDQNQAGNALGITGTTIGFIGTLGGGAEYRVMSNVALGLEASYLFSRGHTISFGDGSELSGNLDSVLLSVALRVFF